MAEPPQSSARGPVALAAPGGARAPARAVTAADDEAATKSPRQPSTITFPVVGIGGSAGALSALLALFEALPPQTGMAFVVVLHL